MATSLDTLSLSQMLDLAIGMPQEGTVHFAAMRKLLQAVLEHLDMQYLTSQEPWPGQLSGPSLADLATNMEKMKKEMEDCKKEISEVLREEIGAIKAENSRISEDLKKFQEAQATVVSQHLEEIEKLKAGQRHVTGEMNKVQISRDQDMDLREEIDRIKTKQIQMEEDVKKLKKTPALIKKMGEDLQKLREDAAMWKEESSNEISQQIKALRQETKRELQMMEEQQELRSAMLEQLVTETVNKVNEQLAEIGEMVKSVQEEQERAKAECSNCTFDLNEHFGELLKRCEKLQEQVESLESRQVALGKLEKMMRNWGQDPEQVQPKEATVVQMQRDYEKLSFISGSLQKDSEKKQKEIEMLFQSLEKLQKEKADHVDILAAMDVKADKAALGSKVNCSQFEANMERLDERMQELQSQISGQEQHWNNTQQQLSLVEEKKLDRLELKTFRDQMEATWNRNIEELEIRLLRENAAGIKKQLPVPFTCLSCDRMLSVQVPGQYPETLPYLQPMSPGREPPPRQRKPLLRGGGSYVPQISGDHQSSSFKLPPIHDSLQNKAFLQGLVTLPSKPKVTQLLGRGGHNPRDQLPVVIRTLDSPGLATSRDQRPGAVPQQGTRAPPATPAP